MSDIEPTNWVSVLVASYNTKIKYIRECIHSIKSQIGNFGIELIWINDGSDYELSNELENSLNELKNISNLKVIYKKYEKNMGQSYSRNEGILLSSNELIFIMDSDDIMFPDRIQNQYEFMMKNKSCMLCGTNMISFYENEDGERVVLNSSNHPFLITWDNYKKNKSSWILNHPTICFRKNAVLEVGNYDKDFKLPFEDLDIELRILKKYGVVCNLEKPYLLYRIHKDQITHKNRNNKEIEKLRYEFIQKITSD